MAETPLIACMGDTASGLLSMITVADASYFFGKTKLPTMVANTTTAKMLSDSFQRARSMRKN